MLAQAQESSANVRQQSTRLSTSPSLNDLHLSLNALCLSVLESLVDVCAVPSVQAFRQNMVVLWRR